MKKILPLILMLTISSALLMGCAAVAQSMESTEADAAYAEPVLQRESVALTNGPAEQEISTASAISGDLCTVCANEDCDGGKYCSRADEREVHRKSNTSCKVCGDDDCDGGRNDRHNNHHSGHHGNHHHNNT